ncbi:MAG: MarR family transcriptional regulator [Chloroflexi bacterium]|nr:MarR family transcriptional regulator [Chloroflexota bacterium]
MTINNTSSAASGTSPAANHEIEHSGLRLWLRLLSCTTLIENQVSSRLRSEFDTTLPRFDLMAQLARFPDGLLMSELSQRLMVSNGNITGITDNLEREGLVERIMLPEDRRARKVRLTAKGRAAFDQMAVTHETWINDWLGSLTAQEQHLLSTLLGKLKQGLHQRS